MYSVGGYRLSLAEVAAAAEMILEQDKMECDQRGDGWGEGEEGEDEEEEEEEEEEEGDVSGGEEMDGEREQSLADSGYSTSPVASDGRFVSS